MSFLVTFLKRNLLVFSFLVLQYASFAQETIVIFAINDPHSEIENFAKIKPLLDAARANNQKVYFVAGGDLFSGNPIVDYHENKGYPMIDMLNKTGLDVSVIGNHEFDYGQEILNDRLEQANFPFICDNVSGGTGKLGAIQGSTIITKDNFSIAFVGVVETGSPGGFPLTHPKKIKGLSFTEGLDSFEAYKDLKATDNVDLVVALTHYGSYKDEEILENYDFVDLVIGGHNNKEYGVKHANGYKVMSGVNLEKISKTTLTVTNKQITNFEFELINLSNPNLSVDSTLSESIEAYYNNPAFYTNIGSSVSTLSQTSTGCFYTDALQTISNSDIVIQNFGGIRDRIYEGIITPFSIYSIDPFGNGFDTYTMSVLQLKNFLNEYTSSFSYSLDSSFKVLKNENGEFIFYKDNILLQDNDQVTLSLNDYISSVFPNLFPTTPTFSFPLTTADYLIEYLTNYTNQPIDYLNCNQRNSTLTTNEIVKEPIVQIYPSFIEINSEENDFNAEIYSMTGKLIYSGVNSNKIDIKFLTNGLYLLKINSKNAAKFKVIKFIKGF
jgi:5'-nucleotidase